MVDTKLSTVQSNLTLQNESIASDTSTIRSLDWKRSRFDIEFGLRNGTTYNRLRRHECLYAPI